METPATKENGNREMKVLLDLSSVLENAPYLLEQQEQGLGGFSLGNTGNNCIHSHANRDGASYPGIGLSLGQSQSSTHTGCSSSHVNEGQARFKDRIDYFRPGQDTITLHVSPRVSRWYGGDLYGTALESRLRHCPGA